MQNDDKSKIIKGQVFYNSRWMTIEKKVSIEQRNRKKIEQGFVFYQGEWITIEEKCSLLSPSKQPEQKHQPSIVINQTFNIDKSNKQTIHKHAHEHRHVHIDPEILNNHTQEKQTILNSYESKLISNSTKNNMIENKNTPLKMIQSDICDDDKLLEDKSNQ